MSKPRDVSNCSVMNTTVSLHLRRRNYLFAALSVRKIGQVINEEAEKYLASLRFLLEYFGSLEFSLSLSITFKRKRMKKTQTLNSILRLKSMIQSKLRK